MKIKLITGFREDQYEIIDASEVHKAYFLFLNPEKRGIFSNGVAIEGKHIQGIKPAINETMGWNPSHKPTGDDWNEVRRLGVDRKINNALADGKKVASMAISQPNLLELPLEEVSQKLLKGV